MRIVRAHRQVESGVTAAVNRSSYTSCKVVIYIHGPSRDPAIHSTSLLCMNEHSINIAAHYGAHDKSPTKQITESLSRRMAFSIPLNSIVHGLTSLELSPRPHRHR